MSTDRDDRKMRVLHVASGDLWAGAEVQAHALLTNLARRDDVEPGAVVLNPGELASRLQAAGVRTWLLDESTLATPRLAGRMLGVLREFAPHIVHTHRQKENVLGGLAAACLGIPSLRTAHGAEEHDVARRDLRRSLARAVDGLVATHLQRAVVAVSDELAGRLRATWPRARIEVIDNVVDVDALRARVPRDAPGEAQDPATGNPHAQGHAGRVRHIGIVGRLVPVKRIDLFLDVARELARRAPGQYCFDVVGDGPLLEETRTRASAMPEACVHCHGFLPDPLPLLAGLDALLITSDHEGLPTVALEALALGVPVVSRPVGGLPALAQSGAGCVLTRDADASSIADAVQQTLLGDPKVEVSLPDRYHASTGARRYAELYGRLLRR